MSERTHTPKELAPLLEERYGHLDGEALLRPVIREVFPGRIALASSFGAEAAVLLYLVSKIDKSLPIIVIDTQKLFPETYEYMDDIVARLGLTDVRRVTPDDADLKRWDVDGTLWQSDPDSCCHIRKVKPLEESLKAFDAWITGRKRYQGGVRDSLPYFEAQDGYIKVNPLASWSREKVSEVFKDSGLPRHPLVKKGFLSIGCVPCTQPVGPDDDIRGGRWRGTDKTECGIHLANSGRNTL